MVWVTTGGRPYKGNKMEAPVYKILDFRRIHEISEMPEYEWRLYYAAIEYAKCGYYIIPLAKNEKRLVDKHHNVNYTTASNKVETMKKWFHPDSGKFIGYNIGIATGKENGCFVIDVDRHGGEDGLAVLRALEEENEMLPMGPSQSTPNGGFHYLFRWQENATSSTSKIGEAIDTRGGTKTACKGHIVTWPSMIDGKAYEWKTSGPLPMIPRWIMKAMGAAWRPDNLPAPSGSGMGRGNENLCLDDFEKQVPVDQVERMLGQIDPDDMTYDQWVRVGMAIRSQYPDDEGFELWDTWSSTGTRYKKGECNIRWEGFSDFGTVRMGTLFYMATEAGWEPDEEDVVAGKIQSHIERINSTYAFTMVGGKARIIRERTKSHESEKHMAAYDLLDKYAFEAFLDNDRVVVDDDSGKSIPIAKIWLASEARRTYPNGIGLFPEGSPSGYYNTWEGFSYRPIKGSCRLFLQHIKQVICRGRVSEYEWVIDWLADLVQNPADSKGTAIVMRGGEGTGKGTLANTIGDLFGSHYMHLIDDAHLTSNFNAFMMDALLVFADEITWGGNKKTSGKLKGLVTEKFLIGERKGVDAQSFRNLTHLMIASNSDWVIPAGADSRRWYVADVSDMYKGNTAYFNALDREIKNGGREAILHFLLEREITNNLRQAPHTEALQEQRNRSTAMESVPAWLSSVGLSHTLHSPCLKDVEGSWPQIVQKSTLFEEYEDWCMKRKKFVEHMNVFFKKVREVGFNPTRVKAPSGHRVPAVKVPELEVFTNNMLKTYGIDLENNDD